MGRQFIFFAKPEQCQPTSGPRSDQSGQTNPILMENSVTTANAKGLLWNLGTLVTKTALERYALQCMIKRKTGTMEIETVALTLEKLGSEENRRQTQEKQSKP